MQVRKRYEVMEENPEQEKKPDADPNFDKRCCTRRCRYTELQLHLPGSMEKAENCTDIEKELRMCDSKKRTGRKQ